MIDADKLSLYQQAMNRIDDLIEYRPFTKEDIRKIMANLTRSLAALSADRKQE